MKVRFHSHSLAWLLCEWPDHCSAFASVTLRYTAHPVPFRPCSLLQYFSCIQLFHFAPSLAQILTLTRLWLKSITLWVLRPDGFDVVLTACDSFLFVSQLYANFFRERSRKRDEQIVPGSARQRPLFTVVATGPRRSPIACCERVRRQFPVFDTAQVSLGGGSI